MLEVLNQHNAIEHGNTKEGDKTNSGRNAERHSPQPQSKHTTNDRKRHGCENHDGILERFESEMEENKNKRQCNRNGKNQSFGGILQILKLSAILNIRPGVEFHIFIHAGLNIFHHRLQVAVAHIHTYHYAAVSIFTRNFSRSFGETNFGQFAERNLHPVRQRHLKLPDIFNVGTIFLLQPYHQIKTLFTFENAAGNFASKSSCKIGVHRFHIHAVKSHLFAVVLHIHLRKSRCFFENDVGCTGNSFYQLLNFRGFFVEIIQVFAENFHRNIGANARNQFVETHFDRLRKFVIDTRNNRQCLFEFIGQAFFGIGRFPLFFGFQLDNHVNFFHRHGVGRHFGCTNAAHYFFHFGKFIYQNILHLRGQFHGFGERSTGFEHRLNNKIAFIERGNKFASHPAENNEC